MAAYDFAIASLGYTPGFETRQVRAITPQAASSNAVAAGKLRDLASLWSSGLSSSLLSTDIVDPFTDEPLEAQEIVARHLIRIRAGGEQRIRLSSKEPEITSLVQFQSVLQTSARVVSRVAALACKFNHPQ